MGDALPSPEPLKPTDAKQRIRHILEYGVIDFIPHAHESMADDELQTTDCMNVLRGGVVEPPELEKGEWRYRVSTQRMCVVVAFDSGDRLRVVTTWRIVR